MSFFSILGKSVAKMSHYSDFSKSSAGAPQMGQSSVGGSPS
jgi:hypothetical protein